MEKDFLLEVVSLLNVAVDLVEHDFFILYALEVAGEDRGYSLAVGDRTNIGVVLTDLVSDFLFGRGRSSLAFRNRGDRRLVSSRIRDLSRLLFRILGRFIITAVL